MIDPLDLPLTIKRAAEQAKEKFDLPLSAWTLHQWVRDGKLRASNAGTGLRTTTLREILRALTPVENPSVKKRGASRKKTVETAAAEDHDQQALAKVAKGTP